jgi:hypothetical protein
LLVRTLGTAYVAFQQLPGRGANMALFVGDEHGVDSELVSSRCLCRAEDGELFAYVARGNEFVRISDHGVWAIEHGDVLVSARSGEPLAYRRGRVYFAADTDTPLYYERAQ